MQQGSDLERIPRRLVRRLLGCQTTELTIDQGGKSPGRLTVAFPDRRENLCHLVLGRDSKGRRDVTELDGRSSPSAYRPGASEDKAEYASRKAHSVSVRIRPLPLQSLRPRGPFRFGSAMASVGPTRRSIQHGSCAPVDVTKGISVSINRRDKVACVRGRRIL